MLQTRSGRVVKESTSMLKQQALRAERKELYKRVKEALDKAESSREPAERALLADNPCMVRHIDALAKKHMTAAEHNSIYVDTESECEAKCAQLAELMRVAKSCVVYTGAGLSTAAAIPDYRGPNGLWTMLAKGVKLACPDFARVQPTYAHMALSAMVRNGLVHHVISQNCDGLHLRSGIDRAKLSELHGNCFVELCIECDRELVRLFDVTEMSAFRRHSTSRQCPTCDNQLRDSIIHFGERLRNGPTYNWDEATARVKSADLIICVGSSLKVLKHYKCLWPKRSGGSGSSSSSAPPTEAARLCIVNIQWTPKDSQAHLKINAYCDDVFRRLVARLGLDVPAYSLHADPLFHMCTHLRPDELDTTKKFILSHQQATATATAGAVSTTNGHTNVNSWLSQSFKNKKKSNCSSTNDE